MKNPATDYIIPTSHLAGRWRWRGIGSNLKYEVCIRILEHVLTNDRFAFENLCEFYILFLKKTPRRSYIAQISFAGSHSHRNNNEMDENITRRRRESAETVEAIQK